MKMKSLVRLESKHLSKSGLKSSQTKLDIYLAQFNQMEYQEKMRNTILATVLKSFEKSK